MTKRDIQRLKKAYKKAQTKLQDARLYISALSNYCVFKGFDDLDMPKWVDVGGNEIILTFETFEDGIVELLLDDVIWLMNEYGYISPEHLNSKKYLQR